MYITDKIKIMKNNPRFRVPMNDKLTNIWLWTVAVAFTVAAICTFVAWVAGLTIFIMRLVNG